MLDWNSVLARPRRLMLRFRRALAALLAGSAVLLVVGALAPANPAGVRVVVTTRTLAAGTVLTSSDVATVEMPRARAPADTPSSTAAVLGGRLAGAMSAGEPVTLERLASAALLKGSPPGTVAAVVRVHDPAEVELLRAGDHVDVYAAGADSTSATLLLTEAQVLTVPPAESDDLNQSDDGGVVVVEATRPQAALLAQASATLPLYVTLDR